LKASQPARRVAVIGAGYAGCAAAVELALAGQQVEVFEAARTVGGRARQVEVDGRRLDNGQHILLGAYSETLRLMRQVGVDHQAALLRLPLQMRYPNSDGNRSPDRNTGSGSNDGSGGNDDSGMDFHAPRLPAPLHLLVALLRARGLAWADKMALARFSTTCRWMDWQLNIDCSVAELLQRFEQTERLTRLMWRPLCIAALNTPPERASARVFLRILQDSLGAKRSASDMLLPRVDLSALLPQPAMDFVAARGGKLHLACPIRALSHTQPAGQWRLDSPHERHTGFDAVILATTSQNAERLLATLPGIAPATPSGSSLLTDWARVPQEAITTCYLQYPATVRLALPFYALLDQAEQGNYGQFVFDRSQLQSEQAGLLAVVVSCAAEALTAPRAALAQALAGQLARQLHRPELAQPLWQQVISEKRATFACQPNQVRPGHQSGWPGLLLAGDYTDGPYPATIEGAVRSGVQAAHLILQNRP
jgi:squalene-associated FAD-dependent desaturase